MHKGSIPAAAAAALGAGAYYFNSRSGVVQAGQLTLPLWYWMRCTLDTAARLSPCGHVQHAEVVLVMVRMGACQTVCPLACNEVHLLWQECSLHL